MSTALAPLWNISEELTALLDSVETCDADLLPELQQQIDAYLGKEAVKVDQVAHVLAALDYEQKAAKDEIARLQDRAKTAKAAQDRLEQYVCRVIAMRGLKKLAGATNTLSVRESAAVLITDEKRIPIEYQRVTVKMPRPLYVELVKAAPNDLLCKINCGAIEEKIDVPLDPIKRALKAGQLVEGADLEYRTSLQRK